MDLDKKQSGFSIIEVVVAITVIVIGLVGVLSLVLQNIQVQYFNKNELIAAQLAQEGLELVRNRRDENWLTTGYDWKLGAGPNSQSDIVQDGTYTIDYLGNINKNPGNIDSPQAILKINSGFYEHSAGANSLFSRLIKINNATDYVRVQCTVRWRERGQTHDYEAITLLYNWR